MISYVLKPSSHAAPQITYDEGETSISVPSNQVCEKEKEKEIVILLCQLLFLQSLLWNISTLFWGIWKGETPLSFIPSQFCTFKMCKN